MGFLLYALVGVLFASVTYYDAGGGKEQKAIYDPLYLAMFVIGWPVILAYILYRIHQGGTLKYKGKIIWTSKKKTIDILKKK